MLVKYGCSNDVVMRDTMVTCFHFTNVINTQLLSRFVTTNVYFKRSFIAALLCYINFNTVQVSKNIEQKIYSNSCTVFETHPPMTILTI